LQHLKPPPSNQMLTLQNHINEDSRLLCCAE